MTSDLKTAIQATSFTMYASYGQAEYCTLFEPRKGIKLQGDPLTIDEDSPKEFGNKSRKNKSIGKRPNVLESQPKAEYYRKRLIIRKGQLISPEIPQMSEDRMDTPESPFPQ